MIAQRCLANAHAMAEKPVVVTIALGYDKQHVLVGRECMHASIDGDQQVATPPERKQV